MGLNHIVVMVNSRLAIYNKTNGAQIMAPKNINTIFAGLPTGDPCRNRNDGDPIAIWDNTNRRFVVSQFTVVTPYRQCIAVSKTTDPTGSWWTFSIPLSSFEVRVAIAAAVCAYLGLTTNATAPHAIDNSCTTSPSSRSSTMPTSSHTTASPPRAT